MDDAVVVLTHKHDIACDGVIRELTRRGLCVLRYDTAEFPLGSQLAAHLSAEGRWRGCLALSNRRVALEDVRSIWHRRPTSFTFSPDLTDFERGFAVNEARHGLGGVLRGLPVHWVNKPDKTVAANYKPFQLALATSLGLTVPRTVVTNDPVVAREFVSSCSHGAVYKTLTGPPRNHRYFAPLFTSVVSLETLQDDRSVRDTACLFQEQVVKDRDLRITVFGDEVFAVAISTPEGDLDWRSVDRRHLRHDVFNLDSDLSKRLTELVRVLDLSFGAIDMILTPAGECVFLEINANGQWGWLERATNLRLTDAMVRLLLRRPSSVDLDPASTPHT